MHRRRLGQLDVSAIGLGCMGMTPVYGEPDDVESLATLHHAVDLGIDFLDTADAYGHGRNEEIVGRAIRGLRSRVVVASKFGLVAAPEGGVRVDGRPERVARACEASLARLGVEVIDLYYLHRVDPDVPIEETVGAMSRLVEAGKVRFIGLSEAGERTLRRAHAVHPITALQTEYSLWSREPETALLAVCTELGIGFVAYSPLGRGFLTGTIPSLAGLAANDRRHAMPRFQEGNIDANAHLVASLRRLADEMNCTPAQLALAWVLARRQGIVPIPGTKRRKWLDENVGALDIALSPDVNAELDAIFDLNAAAGTRQPLEVMSRLGV